MKEIIKKINNFRDDRNWRQFHNEKDLAISISLESSELLELFQWKSSEETVSEKLPQIGNSPQNLDKFWRAIYYEINR
jgi:mazG nucleotide pyrophosphohydrolase